MIELPEVYLKNMIEAGKKVFPEEMCGLLGGEEKEGVRIVKEIYVLENQDHSREHFTMKPEDQLKAIKDMRKKGRVPLGNFHSHPETPARPSEEDKRLAYDRNASYMILSLMDQAHPVLKSFRISEDVVEEKIEYR